MRHANADFSHVNADVAAASVQTFTARFSAFVRIESLAQPLQPYRCNMKSILILCLATAFASAADDATILNTKAHRLLTRGHLSESLRVLAQAERVADHDLARAMILRNQAVVLLRMADPVAASQYATRALQLVERTASTQDAHLVPILNTLAAIAIDSGRYSQASSLLRRALDIGAVAGPHYEISTSLMAKLRTSVADLRTLPYALAP